MPTTRPSSHDELGDAHPEADLGPGLDGGVGQQRVDDRAADADGAVDAVDRDRAALEDEVPEVEPHGRGERDAGGPHPVEQAPALQAGHAGGLDGVAGEDVARERGPVDDEHPAALAGQQHGGGGAGAAAPDDDGVVLEWTCPASSGNPARPPSATGYAISGVRLRS